MTLRCNICGAVRLSRLSTVKKIICTNCRSNEAEARRIQEKQKQEQIQRLKRIESIERSYRQQTFGLYECAQCGAWFISTREKKYCSEKCAKRRHNKRKEIIRRTRMKTQLVDCDISLLRLYKRDGGVCYMCGRTCDWNDGKWIGDTFYAGETYPSIDHVVALSKGGAHSWENVRLACRRCNSLKRDG